MWRGVSSKWKLGSNKFNMSTNEESVEYIIKKNEKRKRELVKLLFIDVKEGFIQKVD